MPALIATALLAAEQVSDKKDLYPKLSELVVGAVAFAILHHGGRSVCMEHV